MNEQMKNDYKKSVDFWNEALASSPEDYEGEINLDEDWKQIGSETLLNLLCKEVKGWDNILDYGCGSGWASVLFVKNGAKKVLGVDVSPNAIKSAGYYANAFKAQNNIKFEAVSPDWLSNQTENQFDYAYSMNVLDVVPDEIAENIILGLAKVCKKGAKLLIGMNPCFEGAELSGEGRKYEDHYLFINDILRVNNHTDEEWKQMLSKYFTVDRLEHFKWDPEKSERRRLFYLTNEK